MDLDRERDRRDWLENQNWYPWRYGPVTMCALLAAIVEAGQGHFTKTNVHGEKTSARKRSQLCS